MPAKTLIAILILQTNAFGQPLSGKGLANGHPRGYVCGRASTHIEIDGKLDDRAWGDAPWTEYFGDIEGSLAPEPQYRTRVKMLWDNEYLYIGADIEEPQVWATLTKRDTVIFYDNDFEVFIDPDADNHEYFEFEMNALNTGWDLFLNIPYRDGGKPDDAWDIAGLRTAVHVDGTINNPDDTDRGWSTELAIPWSALKDHAHMPSPPRDGDRWRINFSRVEWDTYVSDGMYRKFKGRPEHNWVWSPQWVIDMHWPELWGYVQFTKGQAGTVEFRPDSSHAVRTALMEVYYAQRRFFDKNKRWASSLEEAGIRQPSAQNPSGGIILKQAPNGYEAEFGGMIIRQDSRIEWMKKK